MVDLVDYLAPSSSLKRFIVVIIFGALLALIILVAVIRTSARKYILYKMPNLNINFSQHLGKISKKTRECIKAGFMQVEVIREEIQPLLHLPGSQNEERSYNNNIQVANLHVEGNIVIDDDNNNNNNNVVLDLNSIPTFNPFFGWGPPDLIKRRHSSTNNRDSTTGNNRNSSAQYQPMRFSEESTNRDSTRIVHSDQEHTAGSPTINSEGGRAGITTRIRKGWRFWRRDTSGQDNFMLDMNSNTDTFLDIDRINYKSAIILSPVLLEKAAICKDEQLFRQPEQSMRDYVLFLHENCGVVTSVTPWNAYIDGYEKAKYSQDEISQTEYVEFTKSFLVILSHLS